jgi:hypothetical protein
MSSFIKEDLPKSITSEDPFKSKFHFPGLTKYVLRLKKQLEYIGLRMVSSVFIEQ